MTSTPQLTVWQLLVSGGWVMLPILAASFIAVMLVMYHSMTLKMNRVATPNFKKVLEGLIRDGNITGFYEACKSSPQLIARLMEKAAHFVQNNPRNVDPVALREIVQSEGNRQAASLNQQVVYLMDVGVLAPMLGLFGTVIGILRSFGSIASEATPMRTMLLAGGVSQALVATAAGLIVGISAMAFYSFFRGRVQKLISELESTATELTVQLAIRVKDKSA
jgi:biopolymer transport protein ExbB